MRNQYQQARFADIFTMALLTVPQFRVFSYQNQVYKFEAKINLWR